MIIRRYEDKDNLEWVRCRVLSFLDSAYFDNVLQKKEHYDNPSIELVVEIDDKIVGLLDIEYEIKKGDVCYYTDELGGVIWHLAVLPEYRNRGISTSLLNKAMDLLKDEGIKRLEAWTRDDKWVNDWYENRGFKLKEQYLHVYAEDNECDQIADSKIKKLYLMNTFAHYIGEDKEEIKKKFKRVHECNLYELVIQIWLGHIIYIVRSITIKKQYLKKLRMYQNTKNSNTSIFDIKKVKYNRNKLAKFRSIETK